MSGGGEGCLGTLISPLGVTERKEEWGLRSEMGAVPEPESQNETYLQHLTTTQYSAIP